MRRARVLPSCGLALAMVFAGVADVTAADVARADVTVERTRSDAPTQTDAASRIEIKMAGTQVWGESAATEQQRGLASTFFLRISNDGASLADLVVRGDGGGGGFAVRYLDGGAGNDAITRRVIEGTFVLEDVPAGASRVLRLRATVAGDGSIDRAGEWDVQVAPSTDAAAADSVTATIRIVTMAFARAAGVTLRVPAAVAAITFHESLFGSAVALRPLGTLLRNADPGFAPPPDGPGPGYVVMNSRGRSTPATSASDDVVAADEPILAPVTGTVIRVTSYRLYCAWTDVRLAIRPDQAPERTVQIFHVIGPRVRRGDHVLVSHTVLGRARLFPFRTQTQAFGLAGRHVHLEIERDGSVPLPGCAGHPIA